MVSYYGGDRQMCGVGSIPLAFMQEEFPVFRLLTKIICYFSILWQFLLLESWICGGHCGQDVQNLSKILLNKKVLLRERKRHTARSVASARYVPSWPGMGYPPPPRPDLGWCTPLPQTWDPEMGYPPPASVDRYTDWCQNITFPRTMYAGGKNKMFVGSSLLLQHIYHFSCAYFVDDCSVHSVGSAEDTKGPNRLTNK